MQRSAPRLVTPWQRRRIVAGITQGSLAAMVGISPAVLGNIENGLRMPVPNEKARLELALSTFEQARERVEREVRALILHGGTTA